VIDQLTAAAVEAIAEYHTTRLRQRAQLEAQLDGLLPRPPWGSLLRDTEAGRQRIGMILARAEVGRAKGWAQWPE
jgi:hypothetical protein